MLFLCKINKNLRWFAFLTLICLLFNSHLSYSNENIDDVENKAKKQVSEMMISLKHLLAVGKNNRNEGRLLLGNLLDLHFDAIAIAKYSTMPAWRKASKIEQDKFTILFKDYLIDLAASRFDEFKDVSYEIKSSKLRGSKMVLVDGIIRAPGNKRDKTPVAWRLSFDKKNNLKIIDVEIAKISMIIAQNEEFTSIIRQNKGKFSSLIEVLEEAIKKNKVSINEK